MSKALKRFVNAHPSNEEMQSLMAELALGGPRGTAMIGAAFLDDLLLLPIQLKMVDLTSDQEDAIFGQEKILGSFSARIRMAHALGVIGPNTFQDLNIIREVRNAMAHSRRELDFDTPVILNMLKSLSVMKARGGYDSLDGRKLFVGAVFALMYYLLNRLGEYPLASDEMGGASPASL